MWVPFRFSDVKVVLHYLGALLIGVALTMSVPLAVAIALREWAPALDYLIGIGVAGFAGSTLMLFHVDGTGINRRQALVVTGLVWLVGSLAAAVPLSLSGNYATYLDALFDAMSGLTTSGLTVVLDLDHMASSHQVWRHLLHLLGGQGIVVAALSFAVARRGGAFALYAAEGRDERILPNVVHTTRFIWFVTAVWVVLGVVALGSAMLWLGMGFKNAVVHGFCMTVAAYDTGGFGPQSQNALYYHSGLLESLLMFLMLAGTMNFGLHADVFRGDPKEMWKNLETRVLAVNIAILSAFTAGAVYLWGVLDTTNSGFRKAVFHVVSAHSGTGHQTVYPTQWFPTLGGAAVAGIMLAMAAGGAVSSTAGGIKALRIGVIVQSIIQSAKQALAPDSAVIRSKFHHIVDKTMTSDVVSASMTVFIMYTVTYITGGLIGMAYGYRAGDSLFESISAAANVGLSTGITSASMPAGMKVLYIVQMWAGRLEFLALLVLVAAVLVSLPRRRRGRP